MSHQPERKEKDCLNCGATVAGRYCQVCGQENIKTSQTVWGLFTHFIYDLFHFDGKFFDTLGRLFRKPGFIPAEYIRGRRSSYLDPIRMYLFTSAIFFFLFFTLSNPVQLTDDDRLMTQRERFEYASTIYPKLGKDTADTIFRKQLNYLLDTNYSISLVPYSLKTGADTGISTIELENARYFFVPKKRKHASLQASFLKSSLDKRFNEYKKKFGDDNQAMIDDLLGNFLHKLPYILFVSLPFFALILKLLYVRRRNYLYSDHAVFTLYHYIFTFLLMLFILLIRTGAEKIGFTFLEKNIGLVMLWGGVYLLISMKRFYRQGWGKTVLKFLLLNILGFVVIGVLMVLFFVLSIFQLN